MSIPITNPNPISIPQINERQFNEQWVYSFNVTAPDQTNGTVSIELLPYSFDRKEILSTESAEKIKFNLWEAIESGKIPEATQIFGLLISSISKFRDFANKTGEFTPPPPVIIEDLPPPEDEPTIEEPLPEDEQLPPDVETLIEENN